MYVSEPKDFLKLIVCQSVQYDKNQEHEISQFTIEMAFKIQKALKMEEIVYNELIQELDINDNTLITDIGSISSANMQNYLSLAAVRTGDEKVFPFVIYYFTLH